jgi:hypothetical protein
MLLNPRTDIAHVWLSTRATWTPGANRNASGIEVAPERRMSSLVITYTAEAA